MSLGRENVVVAVEVCVNVDVVSGVYVEVIVKVVVNVISEVSVYVTVKVGAEVASGFAVYVVAAVIPVQCGSGSRAHSPSSGIHQRPRSPAGT